MNLPRPRPLACIIAKAINQYVHDDVARHVPTLDYYPGYNQLDIMIEQLWLEHEATEPVNPELQLAYQVLENVSQYCHQHDFIIGLDTLALQLDSFLEGKIIQKDLKTGDKKNSDSGV